MNEQRWIAYFSMEIGLAACIPTYSGGLGVLASARYTLQLVAKLSDERTDPYFLLQ